MKESTTQFGFVIILQVIVFIWVVLAHYPANWEGKTQMFNVNGVSRNSSQGGVWWWCIKEPEKDCFYVSKYIQKFSVVIHFQISRAVWTYLIIIPDLTG